MSTAKSTNTLPSMLMSLMMVVLIPQTSSDGCTMFRQIGVCLVRSVLSSEQLQLFFHVLAAHLRVSDRGLNGWHPAFGDVPQLILHLFQTPACCPRSMRKIVTGIVEIDVVDEPGFCQARPRGFVAATIGGCHPRSTASHRFR